MPQRLIKDILVDQNLVSALPDATVREAARTMRDRHVGALIVAEPNGRLEGILTERDVVDRVVAEGVQPDALRVEQVMTRNPACVGPDDTVRYAMQVMEGHGVRHLPVCEGERVVGVVSMRDFVADEIGEIEITHIVHQHMAEVIW